MRTQSRSHTRTQNAKRDWLPCRTHHCKHNKKPSQDGAHEHPQMQAAVGNNGGNAGRCGSSAGAGGAGYPGCPAAFQYRASASAIVASAIVASAMVAIAIAGAAAAAALPQPQPHQLGPRQQLPLTLGRGGENLARRQSRSSIIKPNSMV